MVVFDLDDTLHLRADPFFEAVRKMFPEYPAEQALFEDFRRIGDAYYQKWDSGCITERDMFILRVIDTFALHGISVTDEKAERFHAYYNDGLQHIRLAEGIEEALQTAVDMGMSLGILTNGSAARQRGKITALSLEKWIPAENILVSSEIGINKPDPRVFSAYQEWAAKGRQISAGEEDWWYVGDLYENDIEAPAKAGWHTIWLDRYGDSEKKKHCLQPDYLIRSGTELTDLLERIGKKQAR